MLEHTYVHHAKNYVTHVALHIILRSDILTGIIEMDRELPEMKKGACRIVNYVAIA